MLIALLVLISLSLISICVGAYFAVQFAKEVRVEFAAASLGRTDIRNDIDDVESEVLTNRRALNDFFDEFRSKIQVVFDTADALQANADTLKSHAQQMHDDTHSRAISGRLPRVARRS